MAKKYFKRRRFHRKKTTLAKKVAKLSKLVKISKPEIKHFDLSATVGPLTNNPTIYVSPLSNIVQGSGDFQNRIGDKINVKSLRFRTCLSLAAGAVGGQRVRVLAFLFRRNPDAITTTFSTVINLYLSSTTMNTTLAPMAWIDWDNKGSFKTLMDKSVILNNVDATIARKYKMDFNVPLKGTKVDYVNNGSTMSKNEIYVCWISENDTGVDLQYQYRVEYTDA